MFEKPVLRAAFRSVGLLLLSVALSGCGTIFYKSRERGAIWCNDPLTYSNGKHFDDPHMDVARRGYIYALAAAFVLQDNVDKREAAREEDRNHWFRLPKRMKEKERLRPDASGFEAATFELRENPEDDVPSEIIVAYTGSNDAADWISTNLFFSSAQYTRARDYLSLVSQKYSGRKIVVTGFSLGAALAGHVTKDARTGSLVAQAWLFNPSPKLYANDKYDKKIWVGAHRGEALRILRTWPFELLWPGINRIGAHWEQNAQDYYLISAFPIYGHFRWALTRNILFVADYAHLQHRFGPVDPRRAREPREIIEDSYFIACEREKAWRHHVIANQRQNQEQRSQSNKVEEEEAATAKR